MGYLFGIVVVVVILFVVAMAISEMRDRRRVNPTDPRNMNHQQLVRWVDNILADDMVAPLLSKEQKARGSELVATYYNERS